MSKNITFGSSLLVHANGVEETPCGMKIRERARRLIRLTNEQVTCKHCLKQQEEDSEDLINYIDELAGKVSSGELKLSAAMFRVAGFVEQQILGWKDEASNE